MTHKEAYMSPQPQPPNFIHKGRYKKPKNEQSSPSKRFPVTHCLHLRGRRSHKSNSNQTLRRLHNGRRLLQNHLHTTRRPKLKYPKNHP
uniref:Uncharacterized protein n=1 Tax=Lactuca sativa TaxID=4236 RepID=A0A9R1UPI3_LACSA|nr:hypothetical protein LSAT_V11C800402100 [Lactuca sativa]